MTTSTFFTVRDASQVAEARRGVVAACQRAGFTESRCSDAAIVATELATNLLKHAGGGSVIVQGGPAGEIELLSLDRGVGFANLARSMQDGTSSAGSAGTGLGAISRLASTMDVYSQPGQGAVIYAALGAESPRQATGPGKSNAAGMTAAGISVALQGEQVCGDGYVGEAGASGFSVLITDGLGHGAFAAEASRAAAEAFGRSAAQPVTARISSLHEALRPTRGAALAIAQIDLARRTVKYCGIGNISGAVVMADSVRRMVSHNGTAGIGTPRLGEFTYPWGPKATLILHTDGLSAKWDVGRYPGLMMRHPMVIAGVLFRDFSRGRDDATVVVAREDSP